MATDRLGLNDSQLFAQIELNSKKFRGLRDILEYKNDTLYIWNDNTSEILTLVIQDKIDRNSPFQTLSLIDPPNFDISSLTINQSGTKLALSGPKGLAVVEIPKFKTTQKSRILCKSQTLDERSFINTEIKQVSWHPGSKTDSHILVLTSDNNIRVYDAILDGRRSLLEVWPVGRVPSRALSVTASVTHSSMLPMPLLAGLGDTAVAFDFVPRLQGAGNSWVEWSILILRGNGDVYMLIASLKPHSGKPRVVGPLPMYPQTADNYGSDMASILVLGDSLPPIVILASTTGTLYHCTLLIADEEEDDSQQNDDIYQNPEMMPPHSLYVLETLELDVSLISWEPDKIVEASELLAGCGPTPIRLYRDQESRYLIAHSAGVHAVCVGRTITSLRTIATMDIENEDENKLSSLWCDESSRCEFLLCTSLHGLQDDENNLTIIHGLIVTDSPKYLVALLASANAGNHEVVSIPLGSIMFQSNNIQVKKRILKEKKEETDDLSGPYASLLKESFDTHIKKLLWRNVSQPFIKLLPNVKKQTESLSQESLDMLAGALKVLREEYIKRHLNVQQEFEKRVRVLSLLKSTHIESLRNLEKDREQLHGKAEQIAELYESLKEKQMELCKRTENVLRLINHKRPTMSLADQQLKQPLHQVNDNLPKLLKSLAQIKNKMEFHEKVNIKQEQKNKKKFQEVNNQSILIRKSIKEINDNLATLRYQINTCKTHLGI